MQRELDANPGTTQVSLLAVNPEDVSPPGADIPENATLPWLQDTPTVSAWERWHPDYRDVVILGTDNRRTHVFNLSRYGLHIQNNYDALYDLLQSLAR
jgi:hypothetical protein